MSGTSAGGPSAADAIAVREGALTIVGLDDLVAMKRASGRPRDLEDAVAVMRQRP